MVFSEDGLMRLAHATACRSLADRARGQVTTSANERDGGRGLLIEDAVALVREAERVLQLAVATERSRGVSWEGVGEVLGISRQSAHERFSGPVKEIDDGILFPRRDPDDGGLGSWACPDGLEDPERTARDLDGWAVRHREAWDPDRDDVRPVSRGLGHRTGASARVGGINDVLTLARRIGDRELPDGVSDREARRVLLERKVRTYELLAATGPSGVGRKDARREADEAIDDLERWHESDLRDRLGYHAPDDGPVSITLDGKAIATLQHLDQPTADGPAGWYRTSPETGGPSMLVADVGAGKSVAIAGALDHLTLELAGARARQAIPDLR